MKVLKKTSIYVLSILMLTLMAPSLVTYADTTEITWTYTLENDEAILTGFDVAPLGELTIPDEVDGYPVVGLTGSLFKNNTGLTKVVVPESVTTLGTYVFSGCTELVSAEIQGAVTSMGTYTFNGCTKLEKVILGEGCTTLSNYMFKGCTALVEADMQWTDIIKIREGAFKNCKSLTTIHLPADIQTLGDSSFYGIGAETFTVPENVTSIEDWCFARASLKEILFKGDAPTIGTGAFNKITLTAYYSSGNETWTSEVMQNYGGTVTWKAD